MNKELKKIKKLYGEKMMHLCREYFPTILDEEGRLSKIMQDHFAPTKALYENLLAQHKLEDFRVYIFYLYEDKMTQQEIKSLKTPAELLDEAGYILYPECKTEKEIQSFKKYYAPGEELCTFRCNRLNTCRVWFAVKKDVENIKRENFKKINVFPIEFEGEYYDGNDFVAETDLQKMLKSLISFYICYQLKMCECISEAAENLNRNQITRMALDKIEDKELEEKNAELRRKNEEACFKNVENFKKVMQVGDNDG